MIELVEIEESGRLTGINIHPSIASGVCNPYVEIYQSRGFIKPWIGYLATKDGFFVGTCGFKGPPIQGHVEIAFFTFPKFQGKGFASEMAKGVDPFILITVRTLPHEGASPAVLRKNGFAQFGTAEDPVDGIV